MEVHCTSTFCVLVILANSAGTVGIQQHGQFFYLSLQFLTLVSFRYFHSGVHSFKDQRFVLNIVILLQRYLLALERLVGNNPETTPRLITA